MASRVSTGARLHFGFQNLSLAHERLYGGLGVALDEPRTALSVGRTEGVEAPDDITAEYARRAVDHLGVDGARVEVESAIPRHAGLGSGTQLALAVSTGVARAHDLTPAPREAAPALDRGGRSGVGVGTFESGGFVVDAGHPTERFTTDRPPRGQWTVPPTVARHDVPADWRFVLATPDVGPGRSGDEEDASMRAVVSQAEPDVADEVGTLVLHSLLPALLSADITGFGGALAELGRLNGAWYAVEQGGLYRPPVGAVVDELSDDPAVAGVGQSSWGPTVWAATDAERADAAESAAADALAAAGLDGDVRVVAARNEGATVRAEPGE
jgi:beta-ribofuranosylaminobenzene 5'-phosphate synthase